MLNFPMKVSQVLQGDFQLQPLNLLLAFQVNCPGCFVYALPLAARLNDRYGDRVQILGLSTAFEDFHLNTLENTRRLLATGEVVGMTKLYLQHQGQAAYTLPIRFPVAFDWFDTIPPDNDSTATTAPLATHASSAGYTFRTNHLQGTPSWILLDESSTILAQWFGHKSESDVELILHQALAANPVHTVNEQSV
ncbi:MAG: hypothetical protein AAGE59_23585 [Cyanobacteria bacterium P01_F01_bin.86]